MIRRFVAALVWVVLLNLSLLGQSSSRSAPFPMTPVETISGADHPELIPDSTAYRLFFVVVGLKADASDKDRALQAAHLRKIGLSDVDARALVVVLNEFRSEYEAAIKEYNATAALAEASGHIPDSAAFLVQRDALVEITCIRLNAVLTTEGDARLNAYVQGEKRGIKITRPIASN